MAYNMLYYRISGDDIYYCNAQKTGYTEGAADLDPAPQKDKNVILELINDQIIFPVETNTMNHEWFRYCSNKKIDNLDKIVFERYNYGYRQAPVLKRAFSDCPNLEEVDISSGSFKPYGAPPTTLEYMFENCPKLKKVKTFSMYVGNPISNWTGMFKNCPSLEVVDLRGLTTMNVTKFQEMFYNDSSLVYIIVDDNTNGKNTSNPDGTDMFYGCDKLPNGDGVVDITRANNTKPNGYLIGYSEKLAIFEYVKVYLKV